MTHITQSGTEDARRTAKELDTEWTRVAVAYARTIALQITEWIDIQKKGVRVWWTVRVFSGRPILAVYFFVPGHKIGLKDQETPTLDGVALSEIVIATARKPVAVAHEGDEK